MVFLFFFLPSHLGSTYALGQSTLKTVGAEIPPTIWDVVQEMINIYIREEISKGSGGGVTPGIRARGYLP